MQHPWRDAAALAVTWVALVTPVASADGPDRAPPTVLVLPQAATDVASPLEIRARIVDASGVGDVTAHTRGALDTAFTPRTMTRDPRTEDEYVVLVPSGPARGDTVSYYVEATDRLGNGPIRNGDPRLPFVARIDPLPTPAVPVRRFDPADLERYGPAAGALVVGLTLLAWYLRRRRRRVERAFWVELLRPVAESTGAERSEALDQVFTRTHHHPLRGYLRFNRQEVWHWINLLEIDVRTGAAARRPAADRRKKGRGTRSDRRSVKATPPSVAADPEPASPPVDGAEGDGWIRDRWGNRVRRGTATADLPSAPAESESGPASPRRSGTPSGNPDLPERVEAEPLAHLDEEIFWIGLFEPLHALSADARHRRLEKLASRPLDHPRGSRLFNLNALERWYAWARENDPRALAAEASSTRSQGMTMIELLIVIAVLGMVVVISALNLKPLEAPVRTAGQQVRGLLEDTRARAIATTRVHRIRPLDAASLVVEHAASCSSTTWTLDPDRDLTLPGGVLFDSTSWSLCYSSRGLASANLVVTLEHPDFASETLEVLAGGAVRRLP